jgi:SAM-dependent methyltransferase
MKPLDLRRFLDEEAEKPFSGWDFSYLNDRIVEAPLDWSYPSIVLTRLRASPPVQSLLDMGTGGGESFSRLAPFPPFACATEAYPPNVPLARERLEPLGAQVFSIIEGDPLPFADGQFELIINRHEYYDPGEVARILAPGGEFITQQVGDQNDSDLLALFGVARDPKGSPFNLETAAPELEAAGLVLTSRRECLTVTRIFDAGAVVYYLKAMPWEVPDFSVDRYFPVLAGIQENIDEFGYFDSIQHRFLIAAKKKG